MQAAQPRLTRKEKIAQGLPKPEGNRKKRMADAYKEARKEVVTATLSNQAGSPRKFRLVIDLVRGKNVEYTLGVLKTLPHKASRPVYKLVKTAINNWQEKNPSSPFDVEQLVVKTITADLAFMLRRVQPAPQGRAHRIQKRYTTLNIELAAPETESAN